jgi:hypothetical protein
MAAEGPFDGGDVASFIFFFELSFFYLQQTNLLLYKKPISCVPSFFSMNRSQQL